MIHIIWTYSEQTPRGGHTRKTVRAWIIRRNKPYLIGEMSQTFVDDNQLLMMLLERYKVLPKKYFERNPVGGWSFMPWSLKEIGVADIERIV